MLEDFSLVDKRQLLQNKVDWSKHNILTFRKNPTHIILDADTLRVQGYKAFEETMKEIWLYLQ